jgi:hypothetical protein
LVGAGALPNGPYVDRDCFLLNHYDCLSFHARDVQPKYATC